MEAELFKDTYRVQSARLAGYDYGQNGAYFVTICTSARTRFFGEIIAPNNVWDQAFLCPTALATTVLEYWQLIPSRFSFTLLDAFVIMPDHIHGILIFEKPVEALPHLSAFGPQRENLAAVLRGFKAGVSSWARSRSMDFKWQAGFHDRVIRNGTEFEKIRQYISANPSRWQYEQGNNENLFR